MDKLVRHPQLFFSFFFFCPGIISIENVNRDGASIDLNLFKFSFLKKYHYAVEQRKTKYIFLHYFLCCCCCCKIIIRWSRCELVVECMRLRFSFNSDRDASLSYSLFILSAVNIVELYPNWGKKKGALRAEIKMYFFLIFLNNNKIFEKE